MSRRSGHLWLTVVTLSLAVVVGCSGGISGTGRQAAGVSVGQVQDFGSVFVNDVQFDTSGVEIYIEGELIAVVDDGDVRPYLNTGQVVQVMGSFNQDGTTGSANTVRYDDLLEGPITAVDTSGLIPVITIMGYTVEVDDNTNIVAESSNDLGSLAVGETVEVSGFVDSNGRIHATYLEEKSATDCEVKGEVVSVDLGSDSLPDSLSLRNNTLTIDTSSATFSGPVGIGDYVEVKGTVSCGNDPFNATVVEVESKSLDASDGDEVELEGYVTSFTSINSFSVSGIPVETNESTEFEDGQAGALGLGVRVEVEGEMVNGVLVAEEVEFEDGIELESNVTSVVANTILLTGFGLTVFVDGNTEYKGHAANLSEINNGFIHHVQIRGRLAGGSIVASLVESEVYTLGEDVDVNLQGPVDSVFDPSVVVLGETVNTTDIGIFTDNDNRVINSAEFFNALNLGASVEFSGVIPSGLGGIDWQEGELED